MPVAAGVMEPPPQKGASGRLAGQAGWTAAAARYGIPHLRLRQVAALVGETGAKSMVDVGCSSGFLRTLCPGVRYVGVDFIEPATAPEFEFHAVNLNREGLPDSLRELELITCSGSLEYVERLGEVLGHLRDRLGAGGRLVTSYYNFNHISRVWAMVKGRSFWVHPDWRGMYSPLDFEATLVRAGFAVERRVPSFHAFSPSPRIEETVDLPLRLPGVRPWSRWTAHQFLYVARKA